MALNVSIKHSGKAYDVKLDTSQPPNAFKQSIYEVTGVPPDRMKVMIKGGYLKDDTDWAKVAPKEGQSFMVLGTAGELPKPPAEKIIFLEDMTDSQLADALRLPVGLKNLGNTCYMNATVQVLGAVPELHTALNLYQRPGGGDANSNLVASMRELYSNMSKTTDELMPIGFLQNLRVVQPRFTEQRQGVYAQQDADECWVSILNSLSQGSLKGLNQAAGEANAEARFVDQFLSGEMTKTLTCDEAPNEPPTVIKEKILKLDCNISISTNYLHAGILDSLNQKIEKNSPTLGRDAVYSETSRVSRLPVNLTVHMVRFYWRRDISKKAKIMRKVKFPFELDAIDLVTPELKERLLPLNTKLKEFEKERDERRKVRRKSKAKAKEDAEVAAVTTQGTSAPTEASSSTGGEAPMEGVTSTAPPPGVIEEEPAARERELKVLSALVDPESAADVGSSPHGLYELVGIVTHKGASADGGHYIGWAKKDAIEEANSNGNYKPNFDDPKDEWFKFDDDKVSVVKQDKITSLDGGGEDSTAYILLYRSKSLA